MTRNVEVFYLPLLFLTVALLGGLRVADRVVFVPPPVSALVLAALLIVVLVRCAALAPEALMSAARPALANLNGAVVLLAAFAAAVQAFSVVTPDIGLPRLLVTIFLFVLLLNTLAASPEPGHVVRSVAVILGAMFVLKFIVLAAISDPQGGWLKRVLLAMLEGATLGTVTQPLVAPVTGYVSFVAIVLFLVGLALLPRSGGGRPLPPARIV